MNFTEDKQAIVPKEAVDELKLLSKDLDYLLTFEEFTQITDVYLKAMDRIQGDVESEMNKLNIN